MNSRTISCLLIVIIGGLAFGFNVGYVGPIEEFYAHLSNCTAITDQRLCDWVSRNGNQGCQWVPSSLFTGTNGTCMFAEGTFDPCSTYSEEQSCSADTFCIWDDSAKNCHHVSGWNANERGVIAGMMMIGAMISSICAGSVIQRLGLKLALGVASVTSLVAISMQTAAWQNPEFGPRLVVLLIGRFATGLAGGLATVVCPMYVGDVARKETAAIIGVCFQVFVTGGILIAAFLGFVLRPPSDDLMLADMSKFQALNACNMFLSFCQLIAAWWVVSPDSVVTPGESSASVTLPQGVTGGGADSQRQRRLFPRHHYYQHRHHHLHHHHQNNSHHHHHVSSGQLRRSLEDDDRLISPAVAHRQKYGAVVNSICFKQDPASPSRNYFNHHYHRDQSGQEHETGLSDPSGGDDDDDDDGTRPSIFKHPFYLLMAFFVGGTVQLNGINAIMNFAPEMASIVGLSNPFLANFIVMTWNFVTTCCCVFLARLLDVRLSFIGGAILGGVACLITALSTFPGAIENEGARNGVFITGILLLIAIFEICIGPSFYVVAQSVFPLEIRGTGCGLSVASNFLFNTLINFGFPIVVQAFSGGPSGNQKKGFAITFIIFGCLSCISALVLRALIAKSEKDINASEREQENRDDDDSAETDEKREDGDSNYASM